MREPYLSSQLTQEDYNLLSRALKEKDKQILSIEEQEKLKAIEEEKIKKRNTIVISIDDLEYKYSDYSPKITSTTFTIRNAFPAKYLPQLRCDCTRLNLTLIIDSTGETSWNADH